MTKSIIKKVFSRKRLLVITILSILIIGTIATIYIKSSGAKDDTKYIQNKVRKGSIDVTISGSGTVTSSSRQDITAKVSGTISALFFKEGDSVKKGDLLVGIDSMDLDQNIRRTKLSIEQAQNDLNTSIENVENLSITSPISGQVSNILINEGDNVNKGADICTITDTSALKFTVSFNESQIKKIYAGQQAEVYLQDYMDIVNGVVMYVNNSPVIVDGGGKVYNVEISINNTGSIRAGVRASAKVNNVFSVDSGIAEYKDVKKIKALSSGTVEEIKIRENEYVSKNKIIAILENDDLKSQVTTNRLKLEDLYIQLSSQQEQQSDYNITALVDGMIIKQDIKVGDTVKQGDTILSVSNPNVMEFKVPIDELDIVKVREGLESSVTVDAIPDKQFKGVVTKVSNEGTTENGVTTYEVTITIQNPENIKEGMNANATIIVQHKENILMLPITAVQKGSRSSFVLVPKDNTGSQNNMQSGTQRSNSNQISSSNSTGQRGNNQVRLNIDPNVTMKPIEVGINNDSFIEIVSGLNEGDIVLTRASSSTTNTQNRNATVMPFGGGGVRELEGGGQRMIYRQDSSGGTNSNSSSGGARQ